MQFDGLCFGGHDAGHGSGRPGAHGGGSGLTNEQTETVYAAFGVARGSVTELTMTNEEERAYLEGLVEESVIGTNSISCVYLELLEEGAGSSVSVSNVTWCTEEMYRGALATAGVSDVRVMVAAPFPVSGRRLWRESIRPMRA